MGGSEGRLIRQIPAMGTGKRALTCRAKCSVQLVGFTCSLCLLLGISSSSEKVGARRQLRSRKRVIFQLRNPGPVK
jgi:hypothetical protein